jgi:DNA-binding beta-propeller fold protein YncE
LLALAVVITVGAGSSPSIAWAQEELFISNGHNSSITVYARVAQGDTAPLRTLIGSATGLHDPVELVVDPTHNELIVANFGNHSITVYARTAQGDIAPLRTLAGSVTGLNQPSGLVIDVAHDELVVANHVSSTITVYARTAQGDTAPLRTLAGSATRLSKPLGLTVDSVHNELIVPNFSNNTITVYERTAQGDTAPLRTLAGPSLSTPVWAVGTTEQVVPISSSSPKGSTTERAVPISSSSPKGRNVVRLVFTGLGCNLLGSILVLVAILYGIAASDGQPSAWPSLRLRYVHILGWVLIIFGFILQMVASWPKSGG